jgi:peptidoglycan-N-acetylglucosamine deacetylase
MRQALFILLTLIVFCCRQTDEAKLTPGICISFDDRTIDDWFQLRDLLNRYQAKVTFFITQFDSLTPGEIEKLRVLQGDGHEIGSHGALHVIAGNYIMANSYQAYLENEIDANTRSLQKNGFEVNTFAYPYGADFWFTDRLLLKKFKTLRSVVPINQERDLTLIDEIFYDGEPQDKFWAISIDNVSRINAAMIDGALQRAKQNNEVLFLYAHKPTKVPADLYEFDMGLLEHILQEISRNRMGFYTFHELR